MYPMLPNQCHENALVLAINKTAEWWTGFALSDDRVWRMHSWGFGVGNVIETTERRELYFGVRVPIAYYADWVARKCVEFSKSKSPAHASATAGASGDNFKKPFTSNPAPVEQTTVLSRTSTSASQLTGRADAQLLVGLLSVN
jgi:hypothetical protein